MNQEEILASLAECGLEDKEARVYLTLLMEGKSKASEVAKRATISRMDAYNSLKKLQQRGIVEATMDKPMRFVPLPVDKALDMFIDVKRNEIAQIRDNQETLSQFLKLTRVEETPEYKFQVLKERKHIRAHASKMVEEATKELLLISTSEGLVRLKAAGLFQELKQRQKTGLNVRVITEVMTNNIRQVRAVMEGLQMRHFSLPNYNMLIADGKEVLHSVSMDDRRGSSGTEDIALWMNSPDFIAAQTMFFENLWRQGLSVEARLQELETGRILQPLTFYLGEGSMYERLRGLIRERAKWVEKKAEKPYELADFGIDPAEIYHAIGNRIGHEIAHQMSSTDKEGLWQEIAELWTSMGLGEMEVDSVEGLTIRVNEPFTCKYSPQAGRPICALDEGIMEGILEAKLGLFCAVSEKLCTADGGDGCRYEVVLPKEAFDEEQKAAEALPVAKS